MTDVTQADREAAADFIEVYWAGSDDSMMKLAKSYRAGHAQGVFARAFAAHRKAALAEAKTRFEQASSAYHNVEHWHDEPAPDGNGSLHDWFMAALTEGGDNE